METLKWSLQTLLSLTIWILLENKKEACNIQIVVLGVLLLLNSIVLLPIVHLSFFNLCNLYPVLESIGFNGFCTLLYHIETTQLNQNPKTRKVKFVPGVQKSPMKFPSIARAKRSRFIMADFSQNVSILFRKSKKRKSIRFRPYEINISILEVLRAIQ